MRDGGPGGQVLLGQACPGPVEAQLRADTPAGVPARPASFGTGDEPYQAFTGVPGLELWHWPASKRTEPSAKMHAKLAVADRRVLLVASADLT